LDTMVPAVLFAAIFAVAFAQPPAIIYVGNSPIVNGTCGTQDAPCNTLLQTFDYATFGDTIRMLPGNYSGPGFQAINIDFDLTIDSLSGADSVTIDLGGQDGFEITTSGVHLTLRGLIITNGAWVCYNAKGSNLTIDACHVSHCGGTATGSALEIQFQSFLLVNNSRFENNKGTSGGVIDIQSSTANLTNSVFFNNTATQNGGAVAISEGQLNVVNCTFDSNRAIDGGAIDVDNQDTVISVNFTTFINNFAGAGGAVEFSAQSYGTFANCTFDHNLALEHGGALYLDQRSGGSVINCTFLNHVAGGRGGTIFIFTETIFELGNSILSGNTAATFGGGVYIASEATLNAWSTTFFNNSAFEGGGLYTEYHCKAHLTWCNFVYNHANTTKGAGGGIYCSDTRLFLNETTFSNNTGPVNKDDDLYCSTFPGYTFCSVSGTDPTYIEKCGDHSSVSSQEPLPFPLLGIIGIVLLGLTAVLIVSMLVGCVFWRIKNRRQLKERSIVRPEDVSLLSADREDFD